MSYPRFSSLVFQPRLQKISCVVAMLAVLGATGCSSTAPASPPTKGAMTGAAVGGLAGAVVGNNSSMGSTTGILGGVAAGAIVGGIVGMVQDAKEKKEQDRLAQERAYSQDLSKRRKEEAARRAANDEELSVAQGFRISDMELNNAQKKLDDANGRLKRLRDERATALNKKKSLDEAQERLLATEAEIARLEEELTRLKGETTLPETPAGAATAASANPADTRGKPGI